uniref:Uncharacterized protein n=1 Tax=Anguilla anguilla TaxID=7936 RepID=A0A0E9SJC8_ANGAN
MSRLAELLAKKAHYGHWRSLGALILLTMKAAG